MNSHKHALPHRNLRRVTPAQSKQQLYQDLQSLPSHEKCLDSALQASPIAHVFPTAKGIEVLGSNLDVCTHQ